MFPRLHSQVRRLCFGAEETYRSYIGGYFAVFSDPNHLGLEGRMLTWTTPGKVAAVYPVRQTGQARAGFLLRRDEELRYDHRDVRGAIAG